LLQQLLVLSVVAAAAHCARACGAVCIDGCWAASAARILYHALEMTSFIRHLYSTALATAVVSAYTPIVQLGLQSDEQVQLGDLSVVICNAVLCVWVLACCFESSSWWRAVYECA
jgi:hypothetical protein